MTFFRSSNKDDRQRARARTVTRALRALGLFLCAGLSCSATAAEDHGEFSLTEIADGVFVHHGEHVSIQAPDRDDIANIGFVVGQRCVAAIDTGGSVAVGRALREAIRARTDTPICYVIDSHVHYDHILGNAAFLDDDPTFVGHKGLPRAVAESRQFFVENFGKELGKRGADAVIGPDKTVKKTLELDLGGRTLELHAYPPAHTTTDLSVYDRKTQTLWLADLLFMKRAPVLDGSLKGWLKVLAGLEKRDDVERVVPGHGPVSAPWPEAARPQERYLQTLLKETRAQIAQGAYLEDALDRVAQSERSRWLLFDRQNRRNITKAFTELEWE